MVCESNCRSPDQASCLAGLKNNRDLYAAGVKWAEEREHRGFLMTRWDCMSEDRLCLYLLERWEPPEGFQQVEKHHLDFYFTKMHCYCIEHRSKWRGQEKRQRAVRGRGNDPGLHRAMWVSFKECSVDFLLVQWFENPPAIQGKQVWSLITQLGSYVLWGNEAH